MLGLAREMGHYVARFFSYFRLRPLHPAEQEEVRAGLSPEEGRLFFAMQAEDQRHSFEMARRVADALPGDAEAVRAALLHDIGKRHHRIGVVGRVLATVLGHLGLPLTASMSAYWNHAVVGGAELRALGSEDFVVEFATHHPGGPPDWVTDPRWPVLYQADR